MYGYIKYIHSMLGYVDGVTFGIWRSTSYICLILNWIV